MGPGARRGARRRSSGCFPAGPPAAIMLYTLGARIAARLAAAQRAGGARVPAARRGQPAGGRAHHRPRQHRQCRGRAGAQARPHSRRRLRQRRPLCRSPTGSRSRPAFPTRYSTGTSPLPPTTYRTLGALIGRRDDAEELARNAEDTITTITGPHRRHRRRSERPRVYYARGPRGLEHRARRLDQRRDDRAAGAERRRRTHAAASPTCRSSRCWRGIPT